MHIAEISPLVSRLFAELVNGVTSSRGGFILNTGDIGLLRSLDKISAAEASRSANDGATIAAHAQHLRYGLSLMNRWVSEGGNPFADAKWDDAWKVAAVDGAEWDEIRQGLRDEAERWLEGLQSRQEATPLELKGMISSVGHLAYHLGAMRQIAKDARGPREGTF